MRAWSCAPMHAHRGQRNMWVSSIPLPHLVLLRQELWRHPLLSPLPPPSFGQWQLDSSIGYPVGSRVSGVCVCDYAQLLFGCWDPNGSLHVYAASTLNQQPSLISSAVSEPRTLCTLDKYSTTKPPPIPLLFLHFNLPAFLLRLGNK